MSEFKSAKRVLAIVAVGLVFLLLAVGRANAGDGQPDSEQELRVLRAENTLLKSTVEARDKEIAALKAELADLKSEVARLKARTAQSQPDAALGAPERTPTSQPTATQPGQIIYKDKARSGVWLNDMYNKFADRIAIVDGRFVDLGEGQAYSDTYAGHKGVPSSYYVGGTPRLGEVFQPTGDTRVRHVRDATSVLVDRLGRDGNLMAGDVGAEPLLYLIAGLDTSKMVDGSPLDCKAMVYVGPWRNAGRTVCRFQMPRKLTREEFQAALKSGFELATYLPIPSHQGAPGTFGIPDKVRIIEGVRSVESYKWFVIMKVVIP